MRNNAQNQIRANRQCCCAHRASGEGTWLPCVTPRKTEREPRLPCVRLSLGVCGTVLASPVQGEVSKPQVLTEGLYPRPVIAFTPNEILTYLKLRAKLKRRYSVDAIPCRGYNPSVSFADSSPYTGEPRTALQYLTTRLHLSAQSSRALSLPQSSH